MVQHVHDGRARRWGTVGLVAGGIAAAVALGEVLLGVAGGAAESSGSPLVVLAISSIGVLVGGLYAGAGLVLLVMSRHPGLHRAAAVGWGLVALAGGCASGPVVRALDPDHPASMVGPLVRLTCTVTAALLIGTALRRRQDVARSVLGVVALAVPLVSISVLSAVQLVSRGGLDGSPGAHVVVELAIGAVWLLLASLLVLLVDPWVLRSCPALAAVTAMALAHVARAADGGRLAGWTLVAVTISLSAALLAVRCAWRSVEDLLRAQRHQGEALSWALTHARRRADDEAVRRDGVTHDARNACAGVRAAVETLSRYEGVLDASASAELRRAAVVGARQLEEVLGQGTGGGTSAPVELDLTAIARDVAASRRAAGAEVTVHGPTVVVRATRVDLARVLLNLVVNAEVHGAVPVVVDVAVVDGTACATVRDRGRGVPEHLRDTLFDRGARQPDSPGQGLGLHLARELARRHAGDVSLVPSDDGAAFVVSLPTTAGTERLRDQPHPVLSVSRDREPSAVG